MTLVGRIQTPRQATGKSAVSRQSSLLTCLFYLIANKQDLIDRAVSLDTIAAKLGIAKTKIVRGSALLNEGVFETLNLLLKDIFEQRSLS